MIGRKLFTAFELPQTVMSEPLEHLPDEKDDEAFGEAALSDWLEGEHEKQRRLAEAAVEAVPPHAAGVVPIDRFVDGPPAVAGNATDDIHAEGDAGNDGERFVAVGTVEQIRDTLDLMEAARTEPTWRMYRRSDDCSSGPTGVRARAHGS